MSSQLTSASSTRRPSWHTKTIYDMTSEERLASLKEWAEEKKYVQPGENGTLATGVGGINALAFGGPMRVVKSENRPGDRWQGQYDAPVGPPSYRVATQEEVPKEDNVVKRWLEKRKSKKQAKRNASVPAYVP